MLKRIIRFSLEHAGLVVLCSLLMLVITWFALFRIPVDVFPELNAPTVVIMTEAGGLSADEVESYVSFQVESGINGLPGLRRVRSSSTLGLSIVWAEFNWDVDIYRARQMVGERLSLIEGDLPDNTHSEMAPISSITGEIMMISLMATDPAVTPMDVRAYAEFDLRNQLLSVPGIAQVVAIGGWLPEYQVEVQQELLQLYNLSSEQVAAALSNAHNQTSAGFIPDIEGLELPLRQSGRVRNINDIKETVVSIHNGTPVRVKDVARVQFGGAFRRGAASDRAQEAVILSLKKAPGTNTLLLTKSVDDILDQIEQALPHGITLNRHVFRQADFIERSVSNVTSTLAEAVIFVVIILVLFLMNVRTTLITLTALPLSLGATILAMWSLDMTINVMTLGGLAVAIGILVDDAIIDVENVFRRLGENAQLPHAERRSAIKVIYDASNEIRSSVVFATVIICMVFIPLLFLEGLEGRFFRPLGMTYMISIIASLFVAMTVTPALCYFLLRHHADRERGDSRLVSWLKACYRPLLQFCMAWKRLMLSMATALVICSLWLASTFGSSFLPEFNEGTFTVFLTMPPGTSLVESERLALAVERQLIEIEGVEHVVRRTGRAERDEHAEPPSSSECEVRMAPDADPEIIRQAIDAVLADIPGVTPSIGQPISHRLSHVLSGTKAQIAINVFGEDMDKLRQCAKDIEQALKKIPGTRDVKANREALITTLPINFRQQDLARYGLSAADAGRQVRRALFGEHIAMIHEGIKRYDLTLRLVQEQRDDLNDIDNLVLLGAGGAHVRLFEVADIGLEQTSNLISRQNAKRKTVVSCNVASGHNLGDLIVAIKQKINPIVTEAKFTVDYGGQFEAQQSASRSIISMSSIIILIMFLLLYSALGGSRPAMLVMLNLPLALIGGVFAMFLAESDNPLTNFIALLGVGGRYVAPVVSIASMVGFITLFGIAVRNGILLLNHFHWLRRNTAMPFEDIISRGSEERLVPVLMTAMTAALGLIPLALKAGEPGSELLAPLAVVVLGGLISATFLNMLIVPVAYALFCRNDQSHLHQERSEQLDSAPPLHQTQDA